MRVLKLVHVQFPQCDWCRTIFSATPDTTEIPIYGSKNTTDTDPLAKAQGWVFTCTEDMTEVVLCPGCLKKASSLKNLEVQGSSKINKIGTKVRVLRLEKSVGLFVTERHLYVRKVGIVGIVSSCIPGHGGEAFFVSHDSVSDVGAYWSTELEAIKGDGE
jgi:hypothetical protein